MIGITGTNAKTTCTLMTAACLHRSGMSSAFSCSELAGIDHATTKPTLTTPDAPELQRWLGEVRDSGSTTAVLEVSSQAISDARVADVAVGIAVCTTIGVDHLDVHGSEAGYRAVKRSLFEDSGPTGWRSSTAMTQPWWKWPPHRRHRHPRRPITRVGGANHRRRAALRPRVRPADRPPQAIVPITNPLLRARADQRCAGRDGCAGRRGKPGGRRGWACRLRGTASSTPGGDPSSVHARR